MAETRAIFITRHQFATSDRLFFDTNIWLFVYGPQASPLQETAKVYSGALKRALKAGSTIEINALVLSEFINRFTRADFENYRGSQTWKQYRASQEYRATAEACAGTVATILLQTQYVDFACDRATMSDLVQRFGDDQADFNDALIVEHCLRCNLTLVTDDGDFRDSGLTLLTHNSKYF